MAKVCLGLLAVGMAVALYTGHERTFGIIVLSLAGTGLLLSPIRREIRMWFVNHNWAKHLLLQATGIDWSIMPTEPRWFASAQPTVELPFAIFAYFQYVPDKETPLTRAFRFEMEVDALLAQEPNSLILQAMSVRARLHTTKVRLEEAEDIADRLTMSQLQTR